MDKETVIVTGGSQGIGSAIAQKFASAGNTILLCARTEETLLQEAKKIKAKSQGAIVKTFAADLSEKSQTLAFAEWCLKQDTPGILVNNAGIYLPGNVKDEPEGNMEQMMFTNFFSAYYLTRALIPAMVKNKRGHIFNICSVASLHAYNGGGSYSISKFALDSFSQNLREELKNDGIKVTSVYPGAVKTASWGDFDNSDNRIMLTDDVAHMVWAASQLSPQAVVEKIILRPQLGDLN